MSESNPHLPTEEEYEDIVTKLEGRIIGLAIDQTHKSDDRSSKKSSRSKDSSKSSKKSTSRSSSKHDRKKSKDKSKSSISIEEVVEELDESVSQRLLDTEPLAPLLIDGLAPTNARRFSTSKNNTPPSSLQSDKLDAESVLFSTNPSQEKPRDTYEDVNGIRTHIAQLFQWFPSVQEAKLSIETTFTRAAMYALFNGLKERHADFYRSILDTPAHSRSEEQKRELKILDRIHSTRMYRGSIVSTVLCNVLVHKLNESVIARDAEKRASLPVGSKPPFDMECMWETLRQIMLRNNYTDTSLARTRHLCYTCDTKTRIENALSVTLTYENVSEEAALKFEGLAPWTQTFCYECATSFKALFYLVHQFALTNAEVYNAIVAAPQEQKNTQRAVHKLIKASVTSHIAERMASALKEITTHFSKLFVHSINASIVSSIATAFIEDIYTLDDPRHALVHEKNYVNQIPITVELLRKFLAQANVSSGASLESSQRADSKKPSDATTVDTTDTASGGEPSTSSSRNGSRRRKKNTATKQSSSSTGSSSASKASSFVAPKKKSSKKRKKSHQSKRSERKRHTLDNDDIEDFDDDSDDDEQDDEEDRRSHPRKKQKTARKSHDKSTRHSREVTIADESE
jgi:hypothetical protein